LKSTTAKTVARSEKIRERMVREQIASRGVRDPRVLAAMRRVPREKFLRESLEEFAYQDTPLPIESDQTISQPFVVAYMTECLRLKGGEKVLEIGTGSGYLTALLAHQAQRVISLEINPELARTARANLQRAGIHNAEVREFDGSVGAAAEGPFDVIVLGGCVAEVPQSLLAQLKVGGRLLGIVGQEPVMRATLITRSSEAEFQTRQPWDGSAPNLLNFPAPSQFRF